MYYVYIIRSIKYPEQIYVGFTTNIKNRLMKHNHGTTFSTEKYKPWELIMFIGFKNKIKKAIEFEKYLKSGSGRTFRDKRLL